MGTEVDAPVEVPVEALRAGPSPRRGRLRTEHVEALIAASGTWPPILVSRSSMIVIDGNHRWEAAKALGHPTIAALWFEGDSEAAEVEGIRSNIVHGLPLTLAERKAAASRLLRRHPSWSNAWIADVCGLSPKTLAGLRLERPMSQKPSVERRIGRDGKSRPARPGVLREEVERLIVSGSGLSLRAIAAETGVSKETVRLIRKRLETEGPPTRSPGPEASTTKTGQGEDAMVLAFEPPQPVSEKTQWAADTACSSTDEGRGLAAWLDATTIDPDDLAKHVDAVPLSRLYCVIDEAQRRSLLWADFAEVLRRRIRPTA